MRRRSTPAAFAAAALVLAACRAKENIHRVEATSSLTVAFYNVENLFDPADDPSNPGDDEFTPRGRLGWTAERLERKLDAIARTIRTLDGYRGADIVGVCEVENRAVLDRLAGEFLPAGQYAVVHEESEDERGIDVALLYRPAAVTVTGHRLHHVELGDDRTRQILEVTMRREGRSFTVLVNHWPSRSGGAERSEPKRIAAASTAAGIIDSLYAIDPHADIVMLGDFNDEPFDRSIAGTLDASAIVDASFAGRMINLGAPVAERDSIGSYFYHGDWETIDQIMLSRGVLDDRGLVLADDVESVFAPEFLRDERADREHRPAHRTYKGTQYIGGASDHFPVFAHVGWR
jgi:predicted extracellular nuclease